MIVKLVTGLLTGLCSPASKARRQEMFPALIARPSAPLKMANTQLWLSLLRWQAALSRNQKETRVLDKTQDAIRMRARGEHRPTGFRWPAPKSGNELKPGHAFPSMPHGRTLRISTLLFITPASLRHTLRSFCFGALKVFQGGYSSQTPVPKTTASHSKGAPGSPSQIAKSPLLAEEPG